MDELSGKEGGWDILYVEDEILYFKDTDGFYLGDNYYYIILFRRTWRIGY